MTDWWTKPRRISVVVDTPGWFDPFARELVEAFNSGGDNAAFIRDPLEIPDGGIAFLLSCLKIVPANILARSNKNYVAHASQLPRGRGFSPMVWQIIEGHNIIPVTLFEAGVGPDEGPIVLQDQIELKGIELNDEIRNRLGHKIVEMCLSTLLKKDPPIATPQQGTPTWYRRRTEDDSRLAIDQTIREQFNLLRTVDNDRYPAFFEIHGQRYKLRIEKVDPPRREVDE